MSSGHDLREWQDWNPSTIYGPIDIPLPAQHVQSNSALDVQEGGDHYKSLAIQPVEYIHANKIGYFEGNVIKYVTRWKLKNGIADLEKAKHYLELLIELETKNAAVSQEKAPGTSTA